MIQQPFKILDMKFRLIKSEEEYIKALKRLEKIFQAPNGSKEGDEAELLMLIIEKYEELKYPNEPVGAVDAIKFRMEQLNLSNADLAGILGFQSRVSEVMTKKRKLSLQMIKNLHHKLQIPLESLID